MYGTIHPDSGDIRQMYLLGRFHMAVCMIQQAARLSAKGYVIPMCILELPIVPSMSTASQVPKACIKQ